MLLSLQIPFLPLPPIYFLSFKKCITLSYVALSFNYPLFHFLPIFFRLSKNAFISSLICIILTMCDLNSHAQARAVQGNSPETILLLRSGHDSRSWKRQQRVVLPGGPGGAVCSSGWRGRRCRPRRRWRWRRGLRLLGLGPGRTGRAAWGAAGRAGCASGACSRSS